MSSKAGLAAATVLLAPAPFVLLGVTLFAGAAMPPCSAQAAVAAGPGGVSVDRGTSVGSLAADQLANARSIVDEVLAQGMPRRAAIVAIATAMQESTLRNLNYGDRDSLGLFQQRPSQGYDAHEAVTPRLATRAFLTRLARLAGWETMPVTVAAATIQLPQEDLRGEYAKHEPLATALTDRFWPVPTPTAAPSSPGPSPAAPTSPAAAGSTPPAATPAADTPTAASTATPTAAAAIGAGAAGAGCDSPVAASAAAGSGTAAPPVDGHGVLMHPLTAPLTSPFGMRFHPILHYWRLHSGQDFGAACGTPVHAAADGDIVSAGVAGGYGNRIVINHGLQRGVNLSTTYNHLSSFVVTAGHVTRGQLIAYSGTTGTSTGCHLHFETLANGAYVNPTAWF